MNTSTARHTFFDTHAFVKKLVASGFSEKQAEALAEEQADLVEQKLATKRDLREQKKDIIINLGSMMIAMHSISIAVIAVLIKVL